MFFQNMNQGLPKKKAFGLAVVFLLGFCSLGHAADIELQWQNNTQEELAGYTMYYRPDYCCDYLLPDGSLAPGVKKKEISVSNAPLGEGTTWEDIIPDLDKHRSYYFVVTAKNKKDEESGFSNEARRKAPQIVNPPVVTHVDSSNAVVEWRTDTPGTTVLFYRKGGSTEKKFDPAPGVFRTRHNAYLANLDSGATYFFRAGSSNHLGYNWDLESDDNNPSAEYSFKTGVDEDTKPPVFLFPPAVGSISDTTATIQWQTDEPSSTKVRYDTSSAEWGIYAFKNEDFSTVTGHNVTLTGLTGNTDYYFRVGSADTNANQTVSSEYTFKTARTIDTTPPRFISPPVVTAVTSNLAIIEWATDDYSSTKVRYGLASASWTTYPSKNEDFDRITIHKVVITGLQENTLYYCRAASANAEGRQSISTEFTFQTTKAPDTEAPIITAPPTVTAATNTTATITWSTNEPSNSTIQYQDHSGTWGAYTFSINYADLVTNHLMTLTNLEANTAYYFRVASSDASGNGPTISSNELNFTTDEGVDTDAPQITAPPTVAAKTNHTVTVMWRTDEPSNSMVRYCHDTDEEEARNKCVSPRSWRNYSGIITDPIATTDHRVVITGLEGESTYYIMVAGADIFGNGPDAKPDDNNPSAEIMVVTESDPDTSAPKIVAPPSVTAKTDTVAIVEWATDEPANSMVQYGPNPALWGNYPLSQNNSSVVNNHIMALTGLAASTTYYFRVGSVDQQGNGPEVSFEVSFTTNGEEDQDNAPVVVLPPTVTAIANSSATIEWITDEPSNSVVKYRASDPAIDFSPTLVWDSDAVLIRSDGRMVTHHQVTLTNLAAETRYKFRVGSTDAAGNGPSLDPEEKNNPFTTDTFLTGLLVDETAPKILSEPVVSVDENDVAQDDQSVIIEWETDEPSSSIVKFGVQQDLQEKIGGTTWQNLPWSRSVSEMKTMHRVTLTGLNPNTFYTFRVGSTDAMGNGPDLNQDSTNASVLGTFVTAEFPDTVSPRITNVQVFVVTNKTALITWETDEPSSSIVKYIADLPGFEEDVSWQGLVLSENDAEMTRQHSITVTGVQAATTYHFRVGSVDAKGNGPELNPSESNNPSVNSFFTTNAGADNTAPQIIGDVEVTAITDKFVVLEWITDEPGNSQVQYSNPESDRPDDAGSNSWGEYPLSENDAEMVKHHKVTVTGLVPDSLYYFRVSSTDASGNNHANSSTDRNPSIEFFFETKNADPPSVIVSGDNDYPDAYPKIDHANNTIDITYDEPNMKNADEEGYYTFSPPLNFSTSGSSIQEISNGEDYSTFRFFFKSIPRYTIITLTLTENITDADNYPVSPNSIVLNDYDRDDLPDDWEVAWGLNPTSGDAEIGEGKLGDFDGDGTNNYLEFLNGTDPKNYTSFSSSQLKIVKSIPFYRSDAGATRNVADVTSFGVLVVDGGSGININDNGSIRIVINDSVNDAYEVDLSNDETVRTVKLYANEADNAVSALWVVYDRSQEELAALRSYPFGAEVHFEVEIKNSDGYLIHKEFYCEIESEEQHDALLASTKIARVRAIDLQDPDVTDPNYDYDMGIEVVSGELEHTKLIFNSDHPVAPVLIAEIDHAENITPANLSTFILPPTVFSPPAKIIIPIFGAHSVDNLDIYVKTGDSWVRSCSSSCGVNDSGYGWMVPGSRVNHNNGNPSSIEIKVYHSAGFHAGVEVRPELVETPSDDDAEAAKCFINTLMR